MKRETLIVIRNCGALGAALVLLGGVAAYRLSQNPLDSLVDARTPGEYQSWRFNIDDRLSLLQRRWLDAALTEIKFRAMGVGQVSGAEFIEDAVRADIDGRTVREVMREGLTWKATRLGVELKELLASRLRNQRLRTKPGDTASRDYLEHFDARLGERIDRCRRDFEETREELASSVD